MIEKKLQNKMEMIIAASKKKMGEMRDAYNKVTLGAKATLPAVANKHGAETVLSYS